MLHFVFIFLISQTVITEETLPPDLIILIDESGSMKKTDLRIMLGDILSVVIENSSSESRVAVVGFGEKARIIKSPTKTSQMGKDYINDVIKTIRVTAKYTLMKEAVELALTLISENPAVLILITDGVIQETDLPKGTDVGKYIQEMTDMLSRANIPIFAFDMKREGQSELLLQLSKISKGSGYLKVERDVKRALAEIKRLSQKTREVVKEVKIEPATLKIKTDMESEIFLKGSFQGMGKSLTIQTAPGEFEIVIKSCASKSYKIKALPGSVTEIVVNFLAEVNLESKPDQAKISINDRDYGFTPSVLNLCEGEYKFQLNKEMYLPKEFELSVRGGDSYSISVTLVSQFEEFEKGVNQYENGEYEEAALTLSSLKNIYPDSTTVLLWLGKAYLGIPNLSLGISYLKKAYEINPKDEKVTDALLDTLAGAQMLGDIIKLADYAEKRGVTSSKLLYFQSRAYFGMADYIKSKDGFEKLVYDPTYSQESNYYLGIIYSKYGMLLTAKSHFEKSVDGDKTEIKELSYRAIETLQKRISGPRFSTSYRLEFDTNVILKPEGILVNIEDKEISDEKDIVHSFSLSPGYKFGYGIINFDISYSFFQNLYHKITQYNFQMHSPSISVSPEIAPKHFLTANYSFGYALLGMKSYFYSNTLQNSYIYSRTNFSPVIGFTLQQIEYSTKPPSKDEKRDSISLIPSIGVLTTFGSSMFRLSYELSRNISAGKNWDNLSHTGVLSHQTLINRFGINSTLSISSTDYLNEHSVARIKRKDTIISISAGLGYSFDVSKDIVLYLYPVASWTKSFSNLVLEGIKPYEYSKFVFGFGSRLSI